MVQKLVMILMMLSLVGCSTAVSAEKLELQNDEETIVYSFTGENEGFSLYNGVIVLSPEQQSLYGGELQNNQENLSDIMSYSVEYFILSDERKESLFTIETGNLTEDNEMFTRERLVLPGVTSEDIFKTNIQEDIKNNFYLEVTSTKTNGDKQSYQIKLDATKVGVNINHD